MAQEAKDALLGGMKLRKIVTSLSGILHSPTGCHGDEYQRLGTSDPAAAPAGKNR